MLPEIGRRFFLIPFEAHKPNPLLQYSRQKKHANSADTNDGLLCDVKLV